MLNYHQQQEREKVMAAVTFEKSIKLMGEAKAEVYKNIEDSGCAVTPTVAESIRNFSMFLDSAYLWLGQAGHFVQAGGTAEAPEVENPAGLQVLPSPEG